MALVACSAGSNTPAAHIKSSHRQTTVEFGDGGKVIFDHLNRVYIHPRCDNSLFWNVQITVVPQKGDKALGTTRLDLHHRVQKDTYALIEEPAEIPAETPDCDEFTLEIQDLRKHVDQLIRHSVESPQEQNTENETDITSTTVRNLEMEEILTQTRRLLHKLETGNFPSTNRTLIHHRTRTKPGGHAYVLTSQWPPATEQRRLTHFDRHELHCSATMIDTRAGPYQTVAITTASCLTPAPGTKRFPNTTYLPLRLGGGSKISWGAPVEFAVVHNQYRSQGAAHQNSPLVDNPPANDPMANHIADNDIALLFVHKPQWGIRAHTPATHNSTPEIMQTKLAGKVSFLGYGSPRVGTGSQCMLSVQGQDNLPNLRWNGVSSCSVGWGDRGAGVMASDGHLLGILRGTQIDPTTPWPTQDLQVTPTSAHLDFIQCALGMASRRADIPDGKRGSIPFDVNEESCPPHSSHRNVSLARNTRETYLRKKRVLVSPWETFTCNTASYNYHQIQHRTAVVEVPKEVSPTESITIHLFAEPAPNPSSDTVGFYSAQAGPFPETQCPHALGKCDCSPIERNCPCHRTKVSEVLDDATDLARLALSNPDSGEIPAIPQAEADHFRSLLYH